MLSTQIIRGLPFQKLPWFQKKNIEDTLDYVPQDGDIIIASYPKTGTTLLQYIIFQIISKGKLFPTFEESVQKYAPLLEVTGTLVLDNLEKPRLYKHHCPYNMVQKNDGAKYIYIYRKPEDTVVSYYNFTNNFVEEIPSLDEFFENFLSGNIGYGNYFDHVLSFFSQKNDKNLLLVSYEKLLLNKKEEVLRIAKFLGEEYFESLSVNDSIMDEVLKHTTFKYMKDTLPVDNPMNRSGDRKVDFFRKGTIGDGKQSLKKCQMKRLKDLAIKRLKGTDLLKEWFDD